MPQVGMLVLLDGSTHPWLGASAQRFTLIVAMDDATGEVLAAEFREQEDAQGYLHLGGSRIGEARLAELVQETVKQTVAPPLSVIGIYAHGWLTDVHDLMVIYDVISLGFTAAEREIRHAVAVNAASGRAEAPALALPTNTLAVMTHWPSRSVDDLGLPTGLTDLLTFANMEQRANLVGRTGMAHLIRLITERLVAHPDLASTRLFVVGHSFGARVLASALTALATDFVFAALQTRNQIHLVLLQPAMPADALEPNTVNGAHPFAQLVNYQNLRILMTKSQWDCGAHEILRPGSPPTQ